jgi:hypothetical protein
VRARTLVSIGIAISGLIVGMTPHASTDPPRATSSVPAPIAANPAALTRPLAPPKPILPMKKLPKGATVKDFQRALNAYAVQSGQTYAVDASSIDPATAGRSRFAASTEPDVPASFTYLSVDQCRDQGSNSFWAWETSTGPGRIHNHYQWCAWTQSEMKYYEDLPTIGRYKTGSLTWRTTLIGWGSKSTNQVVVRVYIDQVNADNGSKVTPSNATLRATTSCEFVYATTSCSAAPGSSQSASFAELAAGRVLEFTTTVDLPAATPELPDRKTGLNLGVKFEGLTTLAPGQSFPAGTIKSVVRCDGSTRSTFTGPACIFGGVVPQWSLSRADQDVAGVAEHIYEALNDPNSTVPPDPSGHKYIPYNLTRTVDTNLNQAQRDRAKYQCKKWFNREPDEQCDEYPFASTYEGTFNDPETNYSVKFIDAEDNYTEGYKRGLWYKDDRILELDVFSVFPY